MEFNEAPFSSTVKFKSHDGFNIMMTVRGSEGSVVINRINSILDHVRENGGKPVFPDQDGNSQSSPSDNGQAEDTDRKPCPIHEGQYLYRREKDGSVWYSHRLENGDWCSGKTEENGSPETESKETTEQETGIPF